MFRVLYREFFDQFFASEAVTSDFRLRQVMFTVLAFLMTPGLFLSISGLPAYAYATRYAPELLDPLVRLHATIFVTFCCVSIGIIAAFLWNSLGFDRRDAMVLGPLPLTASVVIRAKLAAMASVLVGASIAINLVIAVPHSLISSRSLVESGRSFVGLISATTCAAVFVFSVIVTIRALLGMIARGHLAAAAGSLLQCAFVSGLLCFLILVPTAVQMKPRGRGRGVAVYVATVADWLPTNWFVGLDLHLRGTGGMNGWAAGAIAMTAAALAAAILTTIAGYHRQLQLALAPVSSTGTAGRAAVSRRVAHLMLFRSDLARGVSDFILRTVASNSAQQAPIAINVALGLGMIAAGLVTARGGPTSALGNQITLLAMPLMIAFWACIGLRASFFVPSELPASWAFRANAPSGTPVYALATRAAIVAFVGPWAAAAAFTITTLSAGWRAGAQHGVLVLMLVIVLATIVVLTIDRVPFTRPYLPGHAKLKSRWPLYAFGAFVFSIGMARLELRVQGTRAFAYLLLWIALVLAIGEWAIRRSGRRWSPDSDDGEAEYDSVTTLRLELLRFSETEASGSPSPSVPGRS